MAQPRLLSHHFAAAALATLALCSLPDLAAAGRDGACSTAAANKAGTAAAAKAGALPKKQRGRASFYARKFAGRKMADGTPMNPHGNNAASKTLPLGTIARVTNLETGQSAAVTIRDRGPYVRGRIIDLSPSTAQEIGLTRERGLVPVEVVPLVVPAPESPSDAGVG
jgi:rare lipoprotein A